MEITPVEFMFLRVIWDAHHIKFPLRITGANIKELHVQPEPAHPFGRKVSRWPPRGSSWPSPPWPGCCSWTVTW